jgi:hypothetical protein
MRWWLLLALAGATAGTATWPLRRETDAELPRVSEQPPPAPHFENDAKAAPGENVIPVAQTPKRTRIQELIAQLRTGDALARQEACDELGRLGPAAEEAVSALAVALTRNITSSAAAEALLAIGPAGLPPLLEQLYDKNAPFHGPACEAVLKANPHPFVRTCHEFQPWNGSLLDEWRRRRDDRQSQIASGWQSELAPQYRELFFSQSGISLVQADLIKALERAEGSYWQRK